MVGVTKLALMMVVTLMAALALSGCASSKPWKPDWYHQGESISAACKDAIFESSPPNCQELGWCAQYGFQLEGGELCTE